MASEATKIAVRGNMHNDTRVIGIADFKSGSNLTSEAIEAIWRPPWHLGQSKWLFQIHKRVIKISDFKSDVKF